MRRRYRVAGILVVGTINLGLVRTYIWSTNPAVTIPPISNNVQGAATPDFTTKLVSNAYFSAQFPTRFSMRRSTDGSGNPVYLQQLFAAASDSNLYSDQIAITIGKVTSEGIKGISDVQLRGSSKEYSQLYFEWLPETNAVAYEKSTQGYELGIFLAHDKYYVDIVATGIVSKKEQIIHEMQLLVSSITWK